VAKRATHVGEDAAATGTPVAEAASSSSLSNLVLLSADPALLDIVKTALEGRQRLWRADNTVQAADMLVASQNCTLLLDAGLVGTDIPALVQQLHGQFPDLPIIVTGRRDDETLLGSFISSGAVYRFLHKPVSAERIRNFVDAADRRRGERLPAALASDTAATLDVPALRLPRVRLDPAVVGRLLKGAAALAAVLLLLAGITELVRRAPWQHIEFPKLPTSQPAEPVASSPPSPTPPPPAATAEPREDANVGRLLSLAGIALSQGRLVEPEGQNAVELYRRALLLDRDNPQARAGLARAAEQLFTNVEEALLAGDLAAAAAAIDAARSAEPGNPRLDFYSAQLARQRDAGSSSVRRSARVIDDARRAVTTELSRLLSLADARMRQGRLVGGADSAEAYVLAARRSRPDDPGVRQALNALSGRMLLEAREALAEGDTANALRWIERADSLGVDGQSVARLRAEIESRRLASVREDQSRLLALANQRIAQDRLLDPRADSARHYLDLLRAAAPDYPGLGETEALLAERLVGEAQAAAAAGRVDDAARLLAAADAAGASPRRLAPVRAALDQARAGQPSGSGSYLPESELRRISGAPAEYPARAAARGIEGWVDVEYTVRADGTTSDIQVIDAIADWRYEPPVVGGRAGPQRVRVRLRFELADR